MADLFGAKDASGTTVEILTDEVTDASLGNTPAQKQIVGLMDATPNSTNKLIVDSSGRAKVDASGVAVPVTDNNTTLSIDDGAGSLTVDGSVTVQARVRTTDTISVAVATDALMNNTVAVTPAQLAISASASGATTVVPLVAGKKIRIVAAFFVCASAVTVKFQSHTTTATATGTMSFAANGGISLPFNPVGWFDTVSGEALDINLGGAVSVGGSITYVAV